MKLVTFEKGGRAAVGLLNAAGTAVHPVPGCADMQALIGVWPVLDTAAVLRGEGLPLERVRAGFYYVRDSVLDVVANLPDRAELEDLLLP